MNGNGRKQTSLIDGKLLPQLAVVLSRFSLAGFTLAVGQKDCASCRKPRLGIGSGQHVRENLHAHGFDSAALLAPTGAPWSGGVIQSESV